jgi:hypothetical protein
MRHRDDWAINRAMTGHRHTRSSRLRLVVGVVVVATLLGVVAIATVLALGSSNTPVASKQRAHDVDPAGQDAPSTSAPAGSTPPTTVVARTTQPSATGSPLGPLVESYVNGRQGTVSAAVENLSTGQTWTLHPGVAEATASIVKVDIMESLLAQSTISGQPLPPAEQADLTPMIEESDNDSATALWNAAGGPSGISTFNATIGLTDTTPSPCLTCAGFAWPGWGLTTTTATDQLNLLDHLAVANAEIGPSERQEALGLMENVEGSEGWGVTAGVATGTTVALKNGWVPLQNGLWQVNSIGWVDGNGRNYLIAVLDDGNPDEQYGIDTIEQVSTMVWNALGSS